ncbi:MAG: flagellar hook-associated protein FlgK [Spongiibacteraceae bacterium]|nr:flagellar hook-associated protein FlgK [Spongiibacteraceae bacterium]
MSLLSIGVSGLNVSQTALTVTGNNIANASSPSYSRQRVELETRQEQLSGGGFLGAGSVVNNISRVINQFQIDQLRLDTTAFHTLDSYTSNIEQLDSLLAAETGGLGDSISNFYSALESSIQDPTSAPARQVVISSAESLVKSFNTIYDRIQQQSNAVNTQLGSFTSQVSSLAKGIAELNITIQEQIGRGQGAEPSQLLDERDELLRELSELVSVRTIEESTGSVSVFIGNGQTLVIGGIANTLDVQPSLTEPGNSDIIFVGKNTSQVVTGSITGGKLGGLLAVRDEELTAASNEVGRLALAVADTLNQQNQSGLDLEGNFGQNIFLDINDSSLTGQRVIVNGNNVNASDRVIGVTIDDVNLLTTSDYSLNFFDDGAGGDLDYRLVRSSDNTIVTGALTLPLSPPETIISADGFTINLTSGSFQAGDTYTIRPSNNAAQSMALQMTRPQELAYAAPIVTNAPVGNTGTGVISQGSVIEILNATGDPFATGGQLSPPLLIRFTTATAYTVYNNANPASPTAQFSGTLVPGQNNKIFLDAPGTLPQYTGYQVEISGAPAAQDEFTIGYNSNSISDNRNGVILGSTRTTNTMESGTLTFEDAYGTFVEEVGTNTAQARISLNAAESLLIQSQAARDSVAGVNLDEEAANLIKFEQAYNASAQVINVARQLFDTLLQTFR